MRDSSAGTLLSSAGSVWSQPSVVMDQKTGLAALQAWCKAVCEGYPGVTINNMSSAWRDGVGFCALIHRHRPDILDWNLIDYNDWRR